VRRLMLIVSCFLFLTALPVYVGAGGTPVVPPDELAASLRGDLLGTEVDLPGGGRLPLLSREGTGALLTVEQVVVCLETIAEAGGWPEPWLIVQDAVRPFDLVLLLRLEDDGAKVRVVTVFAAERREWDVASLKAAVRETTGRKPAAKLRNIVIQGFSSRDVTAYVYETAPTGEGARGLMALLPKGSILREAVTVDLGDGRIHTLALALIEPRFVPADCSSCRGAVFGHADSGGVLVVLAGEREMEDVLNVSSRLRGYEGKPLVPRFRCDPDDGEGQTDDGTIRRLFRDRRPVRVLDMNDLDGDGHALEFSLPAEFTDCDTHTTLVIAVDRSNASLRILE